jgi:hypothetical protein
MRGATVVQELSSTDLHIKNQTERQLRAFTKLGNEQRTRAYNIGNRKLAKSRLPTATLRRE